MFRTNLTAILKFILSLYVMVVNHVSSFTIISSILFRRSGLIIEMMLKYLVVPVAGSSHFTRCFSVTSSIALGCRILILWSALTSNFMESSRSLTFKVHMDARQEYTSAQVTVNPPIPSDVSVCVCNTILCLSVPLLMVATICTAAIDFQPSLVSG